MSAPASPAHPFTPVTATHIAPAVPASRPSTSWGKVWLVGAGPGDPELLTLKAAKVLEHAQVVVFDHLVSTEILARIPASAVRHFVGKASGLHSLPQEEIHHLLIELAQQGQDVVRLKGGDPFIFGRGGEEMCRLLEAGIMCEVVPGITAAVGAGAAMGIPLTHRHCAQTLVLATGHLKNGTVNLNWATLAQPQQTVVIYMGLNALSTICKKMIEHGLPHTTPAAIIHAATTPAAHWVRATLATLPEAAHAAHIKTPALIMIGEVCSPFLHA